MTDHLSLITLTLRIPSVIYDRWASPQHAQEALEAQGIWPEATWEYKWTIDPVGPFYVAELQVIVDEEELA